MKEQNFNKTVKLIGIFSLLTACSMPKEIIRERFIEPGSPLKVGEGTVDGGGGGNGIGGRPLESYRVTFSQDSLVQTKIKPILAELLRRLPAFALNLSHILTDRSWYVVPVQLTALPPAAIGTYFVADQYALQNHRDVWIDQRPFDPMGEMDKFRLILHEMVMGVRLLSFTSRLDNCLAESGSLDLFQSRTETEIQQIRNECYRLYSFDAIFKKDKPIVMEKEDYSVVRDLTYKLEVTGGAIDGEELKNWLRATGYRDFQ